MECKLSAENTRLEEENKRVWAQITTERQIDRERREKEQEWFRKYQAKLCRLMGMNYPDRNPFMNFEECIDEFLKRVEAIIPDVPCPTCDGTGERVDLKRLGLTKVDTCISCDGKKVKKGVLNPVD